MNTALAKRVLALVSRVRGEPTMAYYDQLVESDRASRSALAEIRLRRLTDLLRHARRHVPAYRGPEPRVAEAGGAEAILEGLLHDLPTLTKDELRRDTKRFLSEDRTLHRSTGYTSGSSGQPLPFVTDQFGAAAARAAVWRALGRFGVRPGDAGVRVWGTQADFRRRSADALTDVLLNRITISSHRIDARAAAAFEQALARRRPRFVYGFTSAVGLLCERLEAARASSPPASSLKAIVVTGERVTPETRARIERVLGAPVCEEYGSTEAGAIAHGCESGSLHVNEENVILECQHCERLLGARPHDCKEVPLLVTELHNRALPVLRYAVGDRVRIHADRCACGRESLRIAEVLGRELDDIEMRNGLKVPGTSFDYLPKYVADEIVEMQFLQEAPGRVRVLFVPSTRFEPSALDRLREKARSIAGPELDLEFEQVSAVPREPSGKIRLVRNPRSTSPASPAIGSTTR